MAVATSETITEASMSVSERFSSSADVSVELELVSSGQWMASTSDEGAARPSRLRVKGLCCRNKPRIRWIRSKGAVLVLLWNCLILNYYGNLDSILAEALQLSSVHAEGVIYLLVTLIEALSLMLLYPLAGWIADVYLGRYRVIKVSLWLMWTGAILLSSCFCINLLLPSDHGWVHVALKVVFFPVALLAMWAGITGFAANVIPFGIDQLSTSSGEQLSAFITWFVLTIVIKYGVLEFPFSCPWVSNHSYNLLLQLLFQAVLVSVALILDSLFKHWFIMELRTSNPFKLVARVLRYAWKNKQPQFRGAFTYQDHTKPSRIDYAKAMFGGPCSSEQVEDVKTFLKIMCALVPMGAALVLGLYIGQTATLFSQHINSNSIPCYGYQAMSNFISFFVVVCAVPLYEFLIRPIMHTYIPTVLTRIGVGIILYILSCAALLAIDLSAHSWQTDSTNYTCLYDEASPANRLHINPLWTMLPQALIGLGIFFSLTAVYEFVFSQSPYNMKGLLMGAIFATTGTFQFIGLALQVPFYLGYVDRLTHVPSCGTVYLLVVLVLCIIWFIVYVLVACGYHKRDRERVQTSIQEEYTVK